MSKKKENRAWMTLFDKEYVGAQYLYHYTNIDKALKILKNSSLKFSKICKANDTLESKPKLRLSGVQDNIKIKMLRDYFLKTNTNHIQLLCFSDDLPKMPDSGLSEIEIYSDYSGRGFSLPRMWAQYAENNTGVCLVFNRSEFQNLISSQLGPYIIKSGKVKYIDQFCEFPLDMQTVESMLHDYEVHNSEVETTMRDRYFFQNHKEFIDYNYFYKLSDWQGENEYRYIAYGDNDLFVRDISNSLVGVIIGERIEPEYEEIISYFCYDVCEVKKITFTCNGCNMSNVHIE